MIAYHGDRELKKATMAKVAGHRKADQLVQGIGAEGVGKDFRGCAVGCTIGTYEHALYEERLGVPQVLARLEDRIFESLKPVEAMNWPTQFLGAIPVGADLSLVWPRFALWLLETELAKWSEITAPVVALYRRWIDGAKPSTDEWRDARKQAWKVRGEMWAKWRDAADAADAADDAAAAAAYAAADAAAAAAAAAYAADAAACEDYWLRVSAKLVELLKAAPVTRKRSRP